MDPSLNKWKDYLSKSCQYLSRKGLYNCLYHMQLFLKVFPVFHIFKYTINYVIAIYCIFCVVELFELS